MRILITGVAGFIGSRVAERLLNEGHEILGLDCFLTDLYPASFKRQRVQHLSQADSFTFRRLDLRRGFPTDLLEGVDVVINFAAMAGLAPSWMKFKVYQDCNLLSTYFLLDAMRSHRDIHLVHASTSSVYGLHAIGAEDSPLNPASPYGVTKLAAEQLIVSYGRTFKLPLTILRYFSVYGPHQRPDMAFSMMIVSIANGREITIFGDGEQTRSNTYIDDAVTATVLAVECGGDGRTFNVCGDEEISLLDFVQIASGILDREPILRFAPQRLGDQRHTRGDALAIRAELGWAATMSFQSGIRAQVEAHLSASAKRDVHRKTSL